MSRIAVVIPVYNQPDALARTLASVDRQSADLEFFIVDDGSDPPVSVDASDYRHPLHLQRLTENSGCTVARNRALDAVFAADFDYVALQDAGDVDIGERMARQAAHLDGHPELAAVGAWSEYVDLDGRLLYVHRAPESHADILARIPFVSPFTHPASMLRVTAVSAVGGYDERYPIASDYELFIRLSRRFPVANLPEILIRKEDNPQSLSLGKRRQSLLYRLRAQRQHFMFSSPRAYLGVLWTFVLLSVPYSAVVAVKRRRGYAR